MTHKNIPLAERIIFALDVETPEQARQWVKRLAPGLSFFKVGLELFLAGGFPMVEWIADQGGKVMLDLKFFDVPATVARAVRRLGDHPVTFATVHGNDAIVRAAASAKGDVRILAVTVLTSFDESDLRAMGMTGSVADLVLLRARRALELGCDGVVSSGLEAAALRHNLGERFLVVTPGIRPGSNVEEDDQKRVMTARMAILNGADHVVVGRPIRDAKDPVAVVAGLQEEIAAALAQPPT